jgi:hypothetical protein
MDFSRAEWQLEPDEESRLRTALDRISPRLIADLAWLMSLRGQPEFPEAPPGLDASPDVDAIIDFIHGREDPEWRRADWTLARYVANLQLDLSEAERRVAWDWEANRKLALLAIPRPFPRWFAELAIAQALWL